VTVPNAKAVAAINHSRIVPSFFLSLSPHPVSR
jgi:hypothetical protein